MNIGIDIDGVLSDNHNFCLEYGSKYCNEIGKYKIEDINSEDTTEIFKWGEDVAHDFWNKYRMTLVYQETRNFADEVIKELRKMGHKIFIITARQNYDEWYPKEAQSHIEEITKNWLSENGIIYDEIIFSTNKNRDCLENDIKVMIEDHVQNLESIDEKVIKYIYDNPYNRGIEIVNSKRVYSWYDILQKLKSENI